MKLVVISDTHNQHERLGKLHGDVLIHCGDMFNLFEPSDEDIAKIDAWFGKQDFDVILVTGGNHDASLEQTLRWTDQPFKNAYFLQDKVYSHKGVTFYGSPWTPELRGHAFYADVEGLRVAWSKIPTDTDVLVTHTPPAGILDMSSRGLELGCIDLERELKRVVPRIHCFGHVHASGGTLDSDGTRYVNASMVNSDFDLVRRPYEFWL